MAPADDIYEKERPVKKFQTLKLNDKYGLLSHKNSHIRSTDHLTNMAFTAKCKRTTKNRQMTKSTAEKGIKVSTRESNQTIK